MLAIGLALCSSIAYGCADFSGGMAAKGAKVLSVVAVAAPASLVVELILIPAAGADFSAGAIAWGAASGFASAAAFVLLYRTLAVGPMSVLSPVTAVVSAVIPVTVAIALGEHLGLAAGLGMAAGCVAIVLLTATGDSSSNVALRAILLALGAGAAIGVQLVCLSQAPDGSGVAPLVAGRTVASILVIATGLLAFRSEFSLPASLGVAVAAGVLDSLANFAFLLASREGSLAVVAVITAMYPASTLLLARLILKERLTRLQVQGFVVALIAVSLLAAS